MLPNLNYTQNKSSELKLSLEEGDNKICVQAINIIFLVICFSAIKQGTWNETELLLEKYSERSWITTTMAKTAK